MENGVLEIVRFLFVVGARGRNGNVGVDAGVGVSDHVPNDVGKAKFRRQGRLQKAQRRCGSPL